MKTAGKAYQHSSANYQIHVLFLDLCQLSPPELGPVCHDREDAGTVRGLRLCLFYSLPKLVCSPSQALIKHHPQSFTRFGLKTSIYFYFETQVILLFLLFLYSRSQPCNCNTFMCVSMYSSICHECVFCILAVTASGCL